MNKFNHNKKYFKFFVEILLGIYFANHQTSRHQKFEITNRSKVGCFIVSDIYCLKYAWGDEFEKKCLTYHYESEALVKSNISAFENLIVTYEQTLDTVRQMYQALNFLESELSSLEIMKTKLIEKQVAVTVNFPPDAMEAIKDYLEQLQTEEYAESQHNRIVTDSCDYQIPPIAEQLEDFVEVPIPEYEDAEEQSGLFPQPDDADEPNEVRSGPKRKYENLKYGIEFN